jgi:hypothetical protein
MWPELMEPMFLCGEEKSYVCIFTCTVWRDVPLELIISVSTEAFWQAFGRFIARRERASVIYCDNGTYLREANVSLK